MHTFEHKQHKIEVNWVSGVVVDVDQHVETRIHGQGGGGQIRAGHGNLDDIQISSSSTLHKQVFLEDANGQQHPVQLTGWDIPLIRGNTLTVVWLIEAGRNWGPYTLVHNHTTGQYLWSEASLKRFCQNNWGKWALWGALVPAVAVWPFFGVIGAAIFGVLGATAGLGLRAMSFNVAEAEAVKQKTIDIVYSG